MNVGLVYLLRKKPVGWSRTLRRRAKGTKGVLVGVGTLVLLLLVLGPQVLAMLMQTTEEASAAVPGFRLWGPPALMLMVLMGMTSGVGLHFRPSEIDFLFPAPIGRRELLLYHVLGRLLVVLLSSLWIAIFTIRWAPHWYGGLSGIFFGLAFLTLMSQLASLMLSALTVRATRRLRRVVLLGVLVSCGVFVAGQQLSEQATLGDAVRALAGSTVVAVIAAPAKVFVEIFVSETGTAFAVWAAGGLAILCAVFGLIVTFDVAYTEGAVRASREVQARLQRMRSGGSVASACSPVKVRFSLPAPPWLGGAGPMAWRQGIEAIRNIRGVVRTALLTVAFPIVLVMASGGSWKGDESGSIALIMIVMMTVLMGQHLALDFRRDLDRMAYLKSLPLPPMGVAFGQILPGLLVFTLLQAVAITVVVLALGVTLPWPWPTLLLLVPFNWLAMAVDNGLFLVFPYRFAPKEAGNFQFMGRTMMVAFGKMLTLLLAVLVAALPSWLFWQLGGGSVLLACLCAGLVLTLEAAMLTFLVGRAFVGFDVTNDVPG